MFLTRGNAIAFQEVIVRTLNMQTVTRQGYT